MSSYPQGFSMRTGLIEGMSMGRHHDCGRAQLALDVLAETVRGVLVLKGPDAHPVPGPLGPEVRFDDVRLEPGAARLPFQASGLAALPRSPHLHGVFADVARRRRERGQGNRRYLKSPRRR